MSREAAKDPAQYRAMRAQAEKAGQTVQIAGA
jgi:hypothetical protein